MGYRSTNRAAIADMEQLNRRRMDAYVGRDIGFLNGHLADDFVSTFPDGAVFARQRAVESLRSGAIAPPVCEVE